MNAIVKAKLRRAFDAGFKAYQSGDWRCNNPYDKQDSRLSIEWQAGIMAAMRPMTCVKRYRDKANPILNTKHGKVKTTKVKHE